MQRILALTKEKELMTEIQRLLDECITIQVETCTDSLDFVDNYLNRYSKLIILDIDLLSEKTTKLIHIIRSVQKDCKILLILSQENMSYCSEALSLGVVSYLIKPFSALTAYKIICSTLKLEISEGNNV
jgi:response regulator of citrate/malate metabolism